MADMAALDVGRPASAVFLTGIGASEMNVGRLLFAAAPEGPGNRPPADNPWGGDGDGSTPCPDPIELMLYVSRHSAHSAQAIRNITSVLSRFKATQVKLTVCDLSADPGAGAKDNITYTPTLVRSGPGPRTYILGHISNPELVLELLADCEEEG
jgi:circadian clock protein KaiB